MKNFIFLVAVLSAAVICLGIMPIGAGWLVSRVVKQSTAPDDTLAEMRRFRIDKGQFQIDGREVPYALATHLRGPLEPHTGSHAGQFFALNTRRSDATVVSMVFGPRAKSRVSLNWAKPIVDKQDALAGAAGLGFTEGTPLPPPGASAATGVSASAAVQVASPELKKTPLPTSLGFALPNSPISLLPEYDAKGIAALKVLAGPEARRAGQVNLPGDLRNGRAYYSYDPSTGVLLVMAGDMSWLVMLDFGKYLVQE